MAAIHLILEGEEAVFSWRDGKVHTEGYDLESERAALALTSFGTGIGVLLVAINDCCKTKTEFVSEVEMFVARYKEILASKYAVWPESQLLFEYCSYSPDPNIRWGGLESARLFERHYKCLLAGKEMEPKLRMANLKQLPEKYFYSLLNLSNTDVNYYLALNKNCPSAVLEILAQDKDPLVRMYVARNPSCPIGVLEILCKDKNKATQDYARKNLAKRKDLEV